MLAIHSPEMDRGYCRFAQKNCSQLGQPSTPRNTFIFQDGTFSVLDFCDAFLENEVQRVLRAYPDTISIDIHCAQLGHWSSLPDKNFTKLCKIRINPVDVLNSGNEKLNAFTGKCQGTHFGSFLFYIHCVELSIEAFKFVFQHSNR